MKSSRIELILALGLTAILVVFGLAYGATRKTPDDTRCSSFVDGKRGLHALYLVLDAIDAKPRRSMSAPSAADATTCTLVLAQPSEPVTKRETAQLVDWVAAGGRLVVVGGPPATGSFQSYAASVLGAFGIRQYAITRRADDETRIADAALAEGLRRIEWPATWAVAPGADPVPRAGKLEELVTTEGRCLAGRLAFGDNGGEVVAVADAGLLANESLGTLDNAVLAARLFTGRDAVVFDEFHQGFQEGADGVRLLPVLAAMLFDTWPGRALLVIAAAGLVFLAGAAVRLGAPEREKRAPRRALSEHAEALGRIFETAAARRETLAILAAGARRVVGPRAGIASSLPALDVTRRLRASPAPGAADLADAMARADAPRAVKDMEMAEVAANLAEAKRRFLHGG